MRQLPAPYLPSGAQIEPPKREMSDGDDHLGSLTFPRIQIPFKFVRGAEAETQIENMLPTDDDFWD